MPVPYTFATQTGNIALSELDANFANVKAAADSAAIVTTAAQPVITSVGQLTSLIVTGNIRTLSGGIYAPNYFYANGQPFQPGSSTSSYGNSNVAAYLPTYTGALTSLVGNVTTSASLNAANGVFSGTITATGNIQGGNIVTNGVINASRNISGGNLVANGAVTGYTLEATVGGVTAFGNISGGNITTAGNVVATQRVQAAAFLTAGTVQGSDLYSTGPVRGVTLQGTNLTVANYANVGVDVNATGNVSAGYFIGNGALLTGIVASGNVTASTAASTLTGNILSSNVTQSSLTSVGTLSSLIVSGNTTVNGTAVLQNVTAVAGTFSSQLGAATVVSPGEIRGASLRSNSSIIGTSLTLSATAGISGAATVGSLTTTGNINAGNVIATSFVGSGAQLTGINGPAFSVIQTSPQVVPIAPTNLTLLFQSKELDSNNCFNTSNGRFTPTVPGWYQINSSVQVLPINPLSGDSIAILIRLGKNGAVIKLGSYTGLIGFQPISTLNCLVYLNGITDYIYCDLVTTANLSVFATSGSGVSTYFQGYWVRS